MGDEHLFAVANQTKAVGMLINRLGQQLGDIGTTEDLAVAPTALAYLDQQRSQIAGGRPQTSSRLFGMVVPAANHRGAVGLVSAGDVAMTGLRQGLREIGLLHADRLQQPCPHDLFERCLQLILQGNFGNGVTATRIVQRCIRRFQHRHLARIAG